MSRFLESAAARNMESGVARVLESGAVSTTAPLIQVGYRWRNDDGSETSATWKAAEDTDVSLALDTNVRLRTSVFANGALTHTPKLYYKKSTDSTWLPVPVGGGAASIAQYAEVTNYETAAAADPGPHKNISGLAWSANDRIVVPVLTYDGTVTSTLPTNANLTFSLAASAATGGNTEGYAYIYTAVAGSAQTGQAIALNWAGVTTIRAGGSAYVISGASGFANADANFTEAAFSKTVSAGSICIYAHSEFNATSGKTQTTASGTANKRHDAGITYGHCVLDWAGVSAGTYDFGITNYTSPLTKVGKVFIEVLGGGPVVITPSSNITAGGQATTAQLTNPL